MIKVPSVVNIRYQYTDKDSHAIKLHLRESAHYNVLTAELEHLLIEQGDDQARLLLVLHNLRFVISVAKQYYQRGMSLDDLIEEGNIGLIEAAKRFKPTMRYKFISYAVWWIRQAITKFILDNRTVVRVPVSQQQRLKKIDRALREGPEGLAQRTSLSEEQIHDALLSRPGQTSIDAPLEYKDNVTMADELEATDRTDHKLLVEDTVLNVRKALDSIPLRERMIIMQYFGIGCDKMSKQSIAQQMGVSQEYVRQLIKNALMMMRENRILVDLILY